MLEITASLSVANSWLRQLRGALGIKLTPGGHTQYPPGIDHTMSKEWLMSTLDKDLKARLVGTSGDLVLQDQFVMDTAKQVRAIIELETPLYSRRRAYFTMHQEKGELFSSFMFRKRTEA